MVLGLVVKFFDKFDFAVFTENIILVIIWTFFLLQLPNKSNISEYIIIPIISSLTCKYIIGDLDKHLVFSKYDLVYWPALFLFSVATIYITKMVIAKNKK